MAYGKLLLLLSLFTALTFSGPDPVYSCSFTPGPCRKVVWAVHDAMDDAMRYYAEHRRYPDHAGQLPQVQFNSLNRFEGVKIWLRLERAGQTPQLSVLGRHTTEHCPKGTYTLTGYHGLPQGQAFFWEHDPRKSQLLTSLIIYCLATGFFFWGRPARHRGDRIRGSVFIPLLVYFSLFGSLISIPGFQCPPSMPYDSSLAPLVSAFRFVLVATLVGVVISGIVKSGSVQNRCCWRNPFPQVDRLIS